MQPHSERIVVAHATRPSLDIAVPGSKSLTNRALMIAALADGPSVLDGALVAEDTAVMREALAQLGFPVEARGKTVVIEGLGGRIPNASAHLDLRLSGTSIRFLAALVAIGHGVYELDGNHRMRERPIGDLLRALNALGAKARSRADNDCPPIVVEARGLAGGTVELPGDRSSQYLSALLMAAPLAAGEVTIDVTGRLQSKPFVDMTLSAMEAFGVTVERDGYRRFRVAPGRYLARKYEIEGDAMAAGYFWAAAAVTGGRVCVTNVGRSSTQGDRRLAAVLGEMGCRVTWGDDWCEVTGPPTGRLRGGRFDLNDMPDQAQTLAVAALWADAPVAITNVWNLRIKETDRLSAMATELRKFGAMVDEHDDGLVVTPPADPRAAEVHTYGDHRMAMAFAIAGLRLPGTSILDPACVAKTYPEFFEDFASLAGSGPGAPVAP